MQRQWRERAAAARAKARREQAARSGGAGEGAWRLEDALAGDDRPAGPLSLRRLARLYTPRRLFIAALILAVLLHAWAALLLPTDFDEPVYLNAAFDYARLLRAGDLNGVLDYPGNPEHPVLVKLLYAGVVLALGPPATMERAQLAARALSGLFGVLTTLVVGLAGGPLAALFFATHTLVVKYTSQAYLEALPLLASTVAVLALVPAPRRARVAPPRLGRWLLLSAVALGVTAASKFSYAPVLVVILYLAVFEQRWSWRVLLPYLVIAAGVFLALDPALWPAPVARLADALFFHLRYTQGADVQQAAYPWFQPFIWVATSAAANWHPDVFFYYGFDGFYFLLAVAGLPREWRERRWLVVWLLTGLLFLFVWPTKWPQYALVVSVPICLLSAGALRRLARWLRQQESYYGWLSQMLPPISTSVAVVSLLFVVFLVVIYGYGVLSVALGSIGWSHLSAANSLLPSNLVYTVLPLADGRVVVGTEAGAAVWDTAATGRPNTPRVFTPANSGLPSRRVLAAVAAPDGRVWFGTQQGVAAWDGTQWQTYRAADLGLADAQTQALVFDSAGRLYAGTQSGVAVLVAGRWYPLPAGLADPHVFAAAAQGGRVWFGTLRGLSAYNPAARAWQTPDPAVTGLLGGVVDLLVDSQGRLWAASLGGGLSMYDGVAWTNYRPANSGLPTSAVNVVQEISPGVLWVGTTAPTSVGGVVTAFDGAAWHPFLTSNSGYSGAEPLALAVDALGRVWVGTRTAGVDLYQRPP
ncbi:MAG: hypothetical protein IT317_17905 [Anaerolineales bacterium]|nr:hypothetical protein [Anaerolineales bacterium]